MKELPSPGRPTSIWAASSPAGRYRSTGRARRPASADGPVQARPDGLGAMAGGPGTSSHRPSHREPHLATLLRRRLVETENDFGTSGDPSLPPGAPGLAGLGADRKGGSLKAIHRLIVTSATYRQSSRHREDAAKADPANRLLARQHRLRLESEVVRDVCLAASGLWNRALGGPPVFPPQPQGSSRLGHSKRSWVASQGEDRFRRGLYTHFWRSTPPPRPDGLRQSQRKSPPAPGGAAPPRPCRR